MRDKLDEWRPIVENSRRTDDALAKFKRRAEDAGDLRRQIRTLEQKYATLEREAGVQASAHTADQQDSSTEQQRSTRKLELLIAELEQGIANEREENHRLALEIERAQVEKAANKVQMEQLLERVHALEIGGSRSSVSDTQGKVTFENEKATTPTREPEADVAHTVPSTADQAPTPEDSLASLTALQAEITALRNNARSREQEAQSQLQQYSKRYPKKQAPKELRTVLDLLGEASQRDEHVFRRLHTCWSQAHQLATKASESHSTQPSAALVAAQRERDALRHEQRLIASAFHLLCERVYRQNAWSQPAENSPEYGVAGASSESFGHGDKHQGTWLAQQRSALAGAIFSRK